LYFFFHDQLYIYKFVNYFVNYMRLTNEFSIILMYYSNVLLLIYIYAQRSNCFFFHSLHILNMRLKMTL